MNCIELGEDDVVNVGQDYYRIVFREDQTLFEQIEVDRCEACNESVELDGTICPECGHDQRRPVMGGYDPELDIG